MNDGSCDGMTSSVRLAEHECEGQDENHIAGLIADMQGPITPIFKAGCCDERSHLAGGLLAGLDQVGYDVPQRSINNPRALEQWK